MRLRASPKESWSEIFNSGLEREYKENNLDGCVKKHRWGENRKKTNILHGYVNNTWGENTKKTNILRGCVKYIWGENTNITSMITVCGNSLKT